MGDRMEIMQLLVRMGLSDDLATYLANQDGHPVRQLALRHTQALMVLGKYGAHLDGCSARPMGGCQCGLDEWRKALGMEDG